MTPAGLEAAELPADAIEIARIAGAWGVKGWFRVLPYSADPKGVFSSKRWFLLPPERGARSFEGGALLRIREARQHGDGIVACAQEIVERDAAEALRGARVFVARSSFPTPQSDEFYWVDLIGLAVVNREGEPLGRVRELLSTGAQAVLVIEEQAAAGAAGPLERMIPFVAAYVDAVDVAGGRITVDWRRDYD